jgi:hypothetical protein
MTKILFIFMCMLSTSMMMAQNLQSVNKIIPFQAKAGNVSFVPESTTLNCMDTIAFTSAKATSLQLLDLNNTTSAQASSQYFNTPQAITISGATFYAAKSDTTGGVSINVPVSIYLAGADSLPTGLPLVTANVAVDTTFGALAVLEKTANFSTPLTMTQPYCVVIENNSPNGVSIVYNSYTNGDGGQQWLSGANIGGTWLNSYVITIGGAPLDADVLVYPHVSYDLTSSFTSSRAYMCVAGDVTFTDNSSPILEDPMYNRAAYFNALELSYSYNFGDGSPTASGIDTTYTYATAPPYTVVQYDTLIGWRTTCVATDTMVLAPITLTTTTNTTLSNCNQSTGTATASPLLGQAPYTYLWDAAAANQTTDVATGLMAGAYIVTITDVDGCLGSDTFNVGNIGAPTITATPILSYNGSPISCNGQSDGEAIAAGTGGTGAYTYMWDAAAAGQTTATATGLMAGVYDVTVTDAANCSSSIAVTLTEPTILTTTANSPVNVSCNGDSDGAVSMSSLGGTAPYTYLWNNGATVDSLSGLPAGNYMATVTDANGCEVISGNVSVSEPTLLTSTATDNGDGTATAAGTGGTAGYTYQWDATAGNQTTAMATGLTNNATYSVTITDANGCISVSTVTVTFVGVNHIASLNTLSIFPVPANTKVFVDLDMNQIEEVSIRILNVTGQTVLEQNLGIIQSERIELNTAKLVTGVYMINFNIGAESITKKLIIE